MTYDGADDSLYFLALLVVGITLEHSESLASEGDRGVSDLRVHYRHVGRERWGEVSVHIRHLVGFGRRQSATLFIFHDAFLENFVQEVILHGQLYPFHLGMGHLSGLPQVFEAGEVVQRLDLRRTHEVELLTGLRRIHQGRVLCISRRLVVSVLREAMVTFERTLRRLVVAHRDDFGLGVFIEAPVDDLDFHIPFLVMSPKVGRQIELSVGFEPFPAGRLSTIALDEVLVFNLFRFFYVVYFYLMYGSPFRIFITISFHKNCLMVVPGSE